MAFVRTCIINVFLFYSGQCYPCILAHPLRSVTYGGSTRHFVVAINLTGVRCEINEALAQSAVCLCSEAPLHAEKRVHQGGVPANGKVKLK